MCTCFLNFHFILCKMFCWKCELCNVCSCSQTYCSLAARGLQTPWCQRALNQFLNKLAFHCRRVTVIRFKYGHLYISRNQYTTTLLTVYFRKHHGMKFNSAYVFVLLLYGSFSHSYDFGIWGLRGHMPWAKTTFWIIINSNPSYALPSRNGSIKSSSLWPACSSLVYLVY